MPQTKPQLNVGKILKGLGYGYLFRNPFDLDYTRDPKNAYLTAADCYAKMLRWDPELAALDKLARLAVLSNETEIVAANDERESEKAGDFCREVVGDIDYWDDIQNALLNAPAQGLSIVQKNHVRDGRYIRIADNNEGAALQHLPLWWFYYRLGDDGQPVLVYRGTYGGETEQELDPELFIIARYNYDTENPYGVGYLYETFWTFVKKNLLDDFILQLCQRGVELERWAQCLDSDTGIKAWNQKADINHALEHLQRRTDSTFPPGMEIHHQPGDSAAMASELNLAARYDNYHAKIILGQTLTTDTGRVGSYELGKIHELQQARLTIARCKKLMQWVNDQLITPLCELNFNIGRAKWKIKYEPQLDLDAFAKRLVDLSKAIKGMKVDREWLHFTLDIPEVEEPEEGEEAPEEEYYELGGVSGGGTGEFGEVPGQFKLAEGEKKKTQANNSLRLIDSQVARHVALSKSAVNKRLKEWKKLIDKSKSYEDLMTRLESRKPEWPEFADALRKATVASYALGFAKQATQTEIKAITAPPVYDTWEDVLRTFKDKVPVDAKTFYDLDMELRPKYFATAIAEDEYMATVLHRLTMAAIEEGQTFSVFKTAAYDAMRAGGYEFPEPYRLLTVFRRHLHTADAAARDEWYSIPEVDEMIWGFEYLTSGRPNVRPSHARLNHTKLPKEHPFWATNTPPNGYNCNCIKVEVLAEGRPREKAAPADWREIPDHEGGFDKTPSEMLRAY